MSIIIPYVRKHRYSVPASPEECFDATARLPEYLRNMLLSPPLQGKGLHQWVFSCVRCLVRHRPVAEIEGIMQIAGAGTGRDLTREVREALRNAWTGTGPRPAGTSLTAGSVPPGGWPDRNSELINALEPVKPCYWEALSPAGSPGAATALSALFKPSELVCMASRPDNARTAPLEEWLPFCGHLPFMVASPMSAVTGVNLSGRESHRCIANTGPRRYAVVEFDADTPEAQLACILKLSGVLPVTMILHSGGKSFHAWFHVEHLEAQTVLDFLSGAAILGADPAVFVRCQLVRVPGGLRDGATRQPVLYFDPGTIPA